MYIFTDDQLWILSDMVKESDIDAFGDLYVTVKDEMRNRRLTY